jgi:hypothetical protein
MKFSTLPALAASALFAFGLSGCGLDKSVTGPEPTAFLKSTGTDTKHKVERLPFQHAWRDPKMVIADYKYIVVRPVTTAYINSDQWVESKSAFVPDKRTYMKRVSALATYWNKSLSKAFSSPVCVFYKTSDTSRPGTLILEVALTEVRFDPQAPAKLPDPTPAGNVTSVITGLPICAFEVRVRDAATGKIVSTASDRRAPEIRVLDPNVTTGAIPNEKICDEWSQQLMEASNIDLFPKVKRNWFSFY